MSTSNNNSIAPKTIRTTADAYAWLDANGIDYLEIVEGDKVRETHVCHRCGGTGIYSPYHGVCYACEGRNSRYVTLTPVKKVAQRLKANKREADKRAAAAAERREASLERQRDWCEANGYGRVTFEEKNAKLKVEREAKREADRRPAPEGRFELTGKIVKVETRYSDFGARLVGTIVVATEDGGEWVAWGTLPSSIRNEVDRGDVVTMTATVERSDRDEGFAFFKRPAKAKITEKVAKGAYGDDED